MKILTRITGQQNELKIIQYQFNKEATRKNCRHHC